MSSFFKETLTTLNTGKNMTPKDKAKLTRETRIKQQQQQAAALNSTQTPSTNAATGGPASAGQSGGSSTARKTPKPK